MFTMTSTESRKGEQTPIDRKYRRKRTSRPFAGEEPEVTLSVGNPAPELGKGIVPGAVSQHDADATHNFQPSAAHEAVAFLRADHRRAQLRHAAGRAPRGEVAFAAGNRGRNADLGSDLFGDASRTPACSGSQGGPAGNAGGPDLFRRTHFSAIHRQSTGDRWQRSCGSRGWQPRD